MKKNQAIRQTESKQYIKTALTQLLNEQKFRTLTVSQITRKAGINRGTFYLHFKDKDDMMLSFKEDFWKDLQALMADKAGQPRVVVTEMLRYIRNDFAFIQAISNSPSVDFAESIKEFILMITQHEPLFEEWIQAYYKIPYDYAKEVFLSSIASIICRWIEKNGEESPEELTDIIFQVIDPEETYTKKS